MSSTVSTVAATTGATVLENRYGRLRWRSRSTISLRPLVNPPEAPPSALPKVPVMMSTRPIDAVVLGRAAPGAADEARGVRVVDHDRRVVRLGQVADRSPGRRRMPSMENTPSVAIRRSRASAASCELRLQVGHVAVGVAEPAGLAEADAVDDAGVVELVADDGVLGAQQRLEQPAVGVEARAVEDRVLRAQEGGQARLQFLVQLLGAADEPHAGQAVAPAVAAALAAVDHARGRWPGPGSCWRRS